MSKGSAVVTILDNVVWVALFGHDIDSPNRRAILDTHTEGKKVKILLILLGNSSSDTTRKSTSSSDQFIHTSVAWLWEPHLWQRFPYE